MTDREIEQLQKELEQLKLDFNIKANRITTKLADIARRRSVETTTVNEADTSGEFHDAAEESTPEPDNKLKKDDYVTITNNYRYSEKGVIG